jgi:D-alanyl-D-alanine-carboxypeptidase/D-alanyl-D-alanine-endopeptidase
LEAASLARPGPRRGESEYSNFGYALLGLVLSVAAGDSFENLLRSRVLEPLELRDTIFDTRTDARLVDGHDVDGERVAHWHNPSMAGCGSLLSTVADLGQYVAAQLRPDATPLAAAIEATHHPRLRRDGGHTALGWAIDDLDTSPRYWHNGGTYGFSAYAAFKPHENGGIAVISSQAPAVDGRLERLANTLLDSFTS